MSVFKYGKLAAEHDPRTLMMKSYLIPGLPDPPQTVDSIARAEAKVPAFTVERSCPMDGNDQYGDCTYAAAAHDITVFEALVGRDTVPNQQAVVSEYLSFTGGKDTGCVELRVLRHWKKNGILGRKISAFVGLRLHNQEDVKRAIWMFGAAYLGFQVQANAESDFFAGKPWQPGPSDGSGHAVTAVKADDNWLWLLTWGKLQQASWDWWYAQVDEAYATLPEEAAEQGFSDQFDFAALESDITLLAA